MVAVNGYKISVFVKGQGSQTLVFLSGAGTASPILDFKDVYDGFSKEYKIVVVERAGYGYSEDTSTSSDVSVILSETRQYLAKSACIRSIYYSFSFDGLLRDASMTRKTTQVKWKLWFVLIGHFQKAISSWRGTLRCYV